MVIVITLPMKLLYNLLIYMCSWILTLNKIIDHFVLGVIPFVAKIMNQPEHNIVCDERSYRMWFAGIWGRTDMNLMKWEAPDGISLGTIHSFITFKSVILNYSRSTVIETRSMLRSWVTCRIRIFEQNSNHLLYICGWWNGSTHTSMWY